MRQDIKSQRIPDFNEIKASMLSGALSKRESLKSRGDFLLFSHSQGTSTFVPYPYYSLLYLLYRMSMM